MSNAVGDPRGVFPTRSGLWVSVTSLPAGVGLERHVEALDRLTPRALEPNVFYESWMLLPALQSLRGDAAVNVLLVFAHAGGPEGPAQLSAVFPLERRRRYRALPIPAFYLWRHVHCALCTPIVDAELAAECFEALFRWLRNGPAATPLVEFNLVAGDGPFARALQASFGREGRSWRTVETFPRALFRPRGDVESFLRATLVRHRRKEIRRLERRLAEQGQLELAELSRDGNVETWIQDFLDLEALGWKGAAATALAARPAEREFFVAAAREAFKRGQLMMLALRHEGRLIAMKCNFLTGSGGFAFKIAYDERFQRFSPGVLLEVHNIARLHARSGLEWMDSCAIEEHAMINRLWPDRRLIATLLADTGRPGSHGLFRTVSVLRWLRRRIASVRTRTPAA